MVNLGMEELRIAALNSPFSILNSQFNSEFAILNSQF